MGSLSPTPAAFTIRPARQGEASAIYRLIWQAHLNPINLDWRRFQVAVDAQDGLLGCAQVRLHADGCRELASLVVIPAARGQGIARALIAQLLGGSPRPLYLRCEESLQPFYEKFGFGVVAVPADIPHSLRRSWQVMRWLKLHLLPGAPALLVMRLDA